LIAFLRASTAALRIFSASLFSSSIFFFSSFVWNSGIALRLAPPLMPAASISLARLSRFFALVLASSSSFSTWIRRSWAILSSSSAIARSTSVSVKSFRLSMNPSMPSRPAVPSGALRQSRIRWRSSRSLGLAPVNLPLARRLATSLPVMMSAPERPPSPISWMALSTASAVNWSFSESLNRRCLDAASRRFSASEMELAVESVAAARSRISWVACWTGLSSSLSLRLSQFLMTPLIATPTIEMAPARPAEPPKAMTIWGMLLSTAPNPYCMSSMPWEKISSPRLELATCLPAVWAELPRLRVATTALVWAAASWLTPETAPWALAISAFNWALRAAIS